MLVGVTNRQDGEYAHSVKLRTPRNFSEAAPSESNDGTSTSIHSAALLHSTTEKRPRIPQPGPIQVLNWPQEIRKQEVKMEPKAAPELLETSTLPNPTDPSASARTVMQKKKWELN